MEWTAGARKVAARRRKEEPEEQRLFLSPPGPHSQTINQTNRQEVGCAATAAALFSPRRLPPLNVYCCCFIFLFFLCLFKYTLLRQLLWPSVSLNVWTFKSCFTTCHFGSTELFNWLVLQAGLFSKRLRYWHGKQEKSHTSSVAELALELPSAFHSVFTQIWCFNRRLLPVFGLENTFQRLCGLCVFLPSASSAATDRLLGGTFLSCAVLVQKTTRPRQRLPRQTTIFALFIDTFAFVILQQPPCSIIQDDFFFVFCFWWIMRNVFASEPQKCSSAATFHLHVCRHESGNHPLPPVSYSESLFKLVGLKKGCKTRDSQGHLSVLGTEWAKLSHFKLRVLGSKT